MSSSWGVESVSTEPAAVEIDAAWELALRLDGLPPETRVNLLRLLSRRDVLMDRMLADVLFS